MARLKVLEGFHRGKSFPLHDEVILGRGPENGICLPDGRVSRQHARIRQRGGDFFVEDLGSANGVVLRGERIPPQTPYALHDGDEMWICSTRFVFRADAPMSMPLQAGKSHTGSAATVEPAQRRLSFEGHFGALSLTPLAVDAPQPKVTMMLDAAASMIEIGADEQQTDKGLREALKRLQAIYQVSTTLGSTADRATLLQKILDYILDIFPAADRAFILLQDKDHDTLVPVAAKKRQETAGLREEVAISHTIVSEVIRRKHSILSFDAMGDSRFHGHTSVVDLSIHSMMCAPLLVGDEVLGLIQVDTSIGPQLFTSKDLQMLTGISAQAAIAVKNFQLVDDFKRLFDALIELLATAIDEKSPYTGGHCRRVPILTMMLAEAACKTQQGPLKDFTLSNEELYELKVAALLHDCGKVITPVHIVDKATKLETIFDRIHLIDTRFEILKRDAEIAFLRKKISPLSHDKVLESPEAEELRKYLQQIDADRDFLHMCNIGGEWMSEKAREKVQEIAQKHTWQNAKHVAEPCLSQDEIHQLTVAKGTLTPEEREVINYHVVATIKMLETLPYPAYLRQVPKLAGVHHEQMNGKGYPKGLIREQIPVPGRILALADIFEALTAKDRPYKQGKPLSEALYLLGLMKQDGHIDPDLFDVFINEQVYLRYAKEYLDSEQIDKVVLSEIPGYTPASKT
jgi:HD-GYP domain-containing protein (c-di-GMP phosphodiesterase class II)